MTVKQALKVAQLAQEYITTYHQLTTARTSGLTHAVQEYADDLGLIADEVSRVGGIDRSDAGRELQELAEES